MFPFVLAGAAVPEVGPERRALHVPPARVGARLGDSAAGGQRPGRAVRRAVLRQGVRRRKRNGPQPSEVT